VSDSYGVKDAACPISTRGGGGGGGDGAAAAVRVWLARTGAWLARTGAAASMQPPTPGAARLMQLDG
jgi:hypothetical protein